MCKSRSYIGYEPNVTVDVLTGPNIKNLLAWTKCLFGHFGRTSYQEPFDMDLMSQLTCQTGPNVRSSTEAVIYLSKFPLKDKQSQTLFKAMKTDFI